MQTLEEAEQDGAKKLVSAMESHMSKIFDTMRVVSSSPTRSGLRIQVRISYEIDKLKKIACYTTHKPVIYMLRKHGLSFNEFCIDGLNLPALIKPRASSFGQSTSQSHLIALSRLVVKGLATSGFEKSTQKFRAEVVESLWEVAKSDRNTAVQNKYQIGRVKDALKTWFDHGFKFGLSEEDVILLMKESIVKTVLDK